MADLRAWFEGLGFRDVRTLLGSGNVVFSVPANKRGALARLETALARRLGFRCPVTVLSGAEVVAAVRENPLAEVATNPSRLLVFVFRDPSDRERLRPLLEQRWAPEVLAIGTRVAYLWCARGIGKSPLWPKVDRALERSGTGRNLRTMTKLMALVEARAGGAGAG
jgi:uncharacterized protein (DUF1697 family)